MMPKNWSNWWTMLFSCVWYLGFNPHIKGERWEIFGIKSSQIFQMSLDLLAVFFFPHHFRWIKKLLPLHSIFDNIFIISIFAMRILDQRHVFWQSPSRTPGPSWTNLPLQALLGSTMTQRFLMGKVLSRWLSCFLHISIIFCFRCCPAYQAWVFTWMEVESPGGGSGIW